MLCIIFTAVRLANVENMRLRKFLLPGAKNLQFDRVEMHVEEMRDQMQEAREIDLFTQLQKDRDRHLSEGDLSSLFIDPIELESIIILSMTRLITDLITIQILQ